MASAFFSANSPAYAWMSLAAYAVLLVIGRRGSHRLRVAVTFPTTVLHEAMHAVVALLSFTKVTEFKVTPERRPDGGWYYGSVQYQGLAARFGPIRAAISAAPAFLGPLLAFVVVQVILLPEPHGFWSGLGWWYLAFNLAMAAVQTSDVDVKAMGFVMRLLLITYGLLLGLAFIVDLPSAPCRYLTLFCAAG